MSDDNERTRVGHCKHDETDVYAGRGPAGRDMLDTPIGERGWLGNPFTVSEEWPREHVIGLFRKVFEDRIEDNDEFRDAVGELSGKTLGCWCHTLDEDGPACHADVIAEWADRLDDEGAADE